MSSGTLSRRLAAEALGTSLLVATVVGSGIMGEQLAAGNVAITLLANAIATGAVIGVFIAHPMFELPLIQSSQHVRTGAAQWFAEFIATFGLLSVILFNGKSTVPTVAASVACYITAAYWFTASTSFANPAVTFARSMTDTFSGIRLVDAPMFMVAQAIGGKVAYAVFRWIIHENDRRL